MRRIILSLAAVSLIFAFAGCRACKVRDEAMIGSQKAPLKVGFMPSAEKGVMDASSKIITDELAKNSGLIIEPVLAKNYVELVDGLASKKIDVAFINPLGSLLAQDWAKAEPAFQLLEENGKMNYRSAIIARNDSGIKAIEDLNGRTFVYSDPYSMAGYLMPLYVFTDKKIAPKLTTFAGSYSDVVEQVYSGKADAGAIYFLERDPDGRIHDGRVKLVNKYPDMIDKVSVIFTSDLIPSPPVVFRYDLNPALKEKMKRSLGLIGLEPNVVSALGAMYDSRGLAVANTADFDKIRDVLKKLGKNIEEVVPGAVEFYRKHLWDVAPAY